MKRFLKNKKGSASLEHMLLLPVIILIFMFFLKFTVNVTEKGKEILDKFHTNRQNLVQTIKDKKGSITIFVCIFMTGFIVFITVLCDILGLLGGKAYLDDSSVVSVASISTAYDEKLHATYRIKAIPRDGMATLENNLNKNFQQTIIDEVGTMYPIREPLLTVTERKTLDNDNELEKQIINVAKEMLGEHIYRSFTNKFSGGDELGFDGVAGSRDVDGEALSDEDKKTEKKANNVLSNIFGSSFLANIGGAMSEFGTESAQNIEQTIVNGMERLLGNVIKEDGFGADLAIGEYVVGVLTNRISDLGEDELPVEPEAEFVVTGVDDNEKSCKKVENRIFMMVYALNARFFLTSANYKAKVNAAVATYSFGNAYVAGVLKVIIPIAWIAAESDIDVEKLLSGGEIPIWKTEKTWSTKSIEEAGIESIIGDVIGEDVSKDEDKEDDKNKEISKVEDDNDSEFGQLSYKDCLRILLLAEKKEDKIARIKQVIEKGMGKNINEFISEIDLLTEGECACVFTAGSWVPGNIKRGQKNNSIKISCLQRWGFAE